MRGQRPPGLSPPGFELTPSRAGTPREAGLISPGPAASLPRPPPQPRWPLQPHLIQVKLVLRTRDAAPGQTLRPPSLLTLMCLGLEMALMYWGRQTSQGSSLSTLFGAPNPQTPSASSPAQHASAGFTSGRLGPVSKQGEEPRGGKLGPWMGGWMNHLHADNVLFSR